MAAHGKDFLTKTITITKNGQGKELQELYLDTALGSAYEVETQFLIANKIGYIDNEKYNELNNGIIEIERQIAGFIRSLRQ